MLVAPRQFIQATLAIAIAVVGTYTYAQSAFGSSQATLSWSENPASEVQNLAALNATINSALNANPQHFCFSLRTNPGDALEFDSEAMDSCIYGHPLAPRMGYTANDGAFALSAGDSPPDFERSARYVLTVTAHSITTTPEDRTANALTVTIDVEAFDEPPTLLNEHVYYDDSGMERVHAMYLDLQGRVRLNAYNIFRDPEGTAVGITAIKVCDSSTPGGASVVANCSPPALGEAEEINDHVVTMTRIGETILDFKVNATNLTSAGVYAAKVYFSGQDQSMPSANVSVRPAHHTFLVKVGANNAPDFGGAIGFATSVMEAERGRLDPVEINPPTNAGDWDANDLDAAIDSANDEIYYSLVGAVPMCLDTMVEAVQFGDMCIALADRGGVAFDGYYLNYESPALGANKTIAITLRASDGWDHTDITIEINIQDRNELYANTEQEGKVLPRAVRLIQGDQRNLDLADYFNDPEGDMLTFMAYASLSENLVTHSGSMLTIHGIGTSSEITTYSDTVTVMVSDGTNELTDLIDVQVRFENTAPRFNEGAGTLTVGGEINENLPAGSAVSRLIKYVDEDSLAGEVALNVDSTLFAGVTEPLWDSDNNRLCDTPSATCTRQISAIALVTTEALNYEAVNTHTVELSLSDGYARSDTLGYVVTVLNQNDPPQAVGSIDSKSLSVAESRTLVLSSYFEDEDANDRVILSSQSKDSSVVTTNVDNANNVVITGVMVGTAEVVVTATDTSGATAVQMFHVTVGENLPPQADDEAIAAALPKNLELMLGRNFEFSLNGLFFDPEGGQLAMTAMSLNNDVMLVNTIDSTAVLSPRIEGEAGLEISATDNTGQVAKVTRTITVVTEATTGNANPVLDRAALLDALPTDRTLAPGETIGIDLALFFTDPDGDELSFSLTSSNEEVLEVTASDSASTFHLMALREGEVELTFSATDSKSNTTAENIAITVAQDDTQVGEPPIFDDEALASALPADNSITLNSYFALKLAGIASDPDGDRVDFHVSSTNADILKVISVSNTAYLIGRSLGTAEIMITVVDVDGNEANRRITIDVVLPDDLDNRPPQLDQEALEAALPPNNTMSVPEFFELELHDLFTDPDPNDHVVNVEAVSSDEEVLFTAIDSTFSLTVLALKAGTATLTLTATDSFGASTEEHIEIKVLNPTANSIAFTSQTLDRNGPLVLNVREALGNSIDPNTVLRITPNIGHADVVSASADGSTLTLTALNEGSSYIKLQVETEGGLVSRTMFFVNVVNAPPVLVAGIPRQQTTRLEDLTIDLTNTFTDADGESIELFASVKDGEVADISLMGTSLTIDGLAVGETTVLLTAIDRSGNRTETSFVVAILNQAPQVNGSLGPLSLEIGGEPSQISIANLFEDDDESMAFSISTDNPDIVDVSLHEKVATLAPLSRGSTTVTITATDVHGASATASGQLTVSDHQIKSVAQKALAGLGRSVISSVSNTLEFRANNRGSHSDLQENPVNGLSHLDRGVDWHASTVVNGASRLDNDGIGSNGGSFSQASVHGNRSGIQSLRGMLASGFNLSLGDDKKATTWNLWSRTDRQSFSGTDYDGDLSNIYVGVDTRPFENWMVGVSLANHQGNSGYSFGTAHQQMDVEFTQLLPYVRFNPTENTTLWGSVGFGQGTFDTTITGAENDTDDLNSHLALLAGKHKIASANRYEISLRGDLAALELNTGNAENVGSDLAASVTRVRAGMEGAYTLSLTESMSLTPFTQLNLRTDGGDGDATNGLELSGGLRLSSSAFTLEIMGHSFDASNKRSFEQSGGSITATIKPSQNGTGFSASVTPRWGAEFSNGNMLWRGQLNSRQFASQHDNDATLNMRIDSQVAYGLLVVQDQFLLRPFVSLSRSKFDSRQLQVGAQLSQVNRGKVNMAFDIAVGQMDTVDDQSAENVRLSAKLTF